MYDHDVVPPDHAAAPDRRTQTAPRRWPRLDARTLALAATVVGLVPFLVLVVQVLAADQFANHGDGALIELRVRDVGSDTPLVGSYQRYGYRMPGPILFYLLVVPYRLLGSDFAGLQVGAVLINAAAFAGIAVTVLKRFGPVPATWAVVLLSVLVNAIGPERLSDPWEPHVTALPFVLFLVLVGVLVSGSARALPFAVGVGTFLAQSQSTLAPTVVALLALGGVALIVQVRRRHPGAGAAPVVRALRRPVLVTATVLAVLWLPVLLHELGDAPSNIRMMLDFLGDPQAKLGFADAWRALALQTDHRAFWITGEVPILYASGVIDLAQRPAVPLSLVALGLATAVAAVRRDRSASLGATVLAAFALGLVSLSRLVGELFVWISAWTWGLGALVWVAVGVCAWRSLPVARRRAVERPVAGALAVAVVVAVGAYLVSEGSPEESDDPVRTAVLALADETAAALEGVDGPVLVRSEVEADVVFGEEDLGVEPMALVVERLGYDVRVPPHLSLKFGEHRAAPGAGTEVVLLTEGVTEPPPGAEVVGTVPTITDDEVAEMEALTASLRARDLDGARVEDIPAGGENDILRLDVGRLIQLRAKQPVAVAVGPVGG